VARLRNYEPTWLGPHLRLEGDLSLAAEERATLARALGLPLDGMHDVTIGEVADHLARTAPNGHAGPLPARGAPRAQAAWALVFGQASPDDPDLAAALCRHLAACPSPVVSFELPGATHRFAVVFDRAAPSWAADLQTALAAPGQSAPERGVWWGDGAGAAAPPGKTAWLFPGSGSLYDGFLDDLTGLSPVVSEVVDAAKGAYRDLVGRELDFGPSTDPLVQRPATVAASAAIVRLLSHFGLTPDLVAGHSVGELTACYAAGALDLPELIRLAAAPFLGLDPYPRGRMLALGGPEDAVRGLLGSSDGRVVVSNRNGSRRLVVSGREADVLRLQEQAKEQGMAARLLEVEIPYHSPLLGPAHERYRRALESLRLQVPAVPVVSGLTGDVLPWSDRDPAQIRSLLDCAFIAPVNYVAQLQRLHDLGARVLVDVGPTERLARMARDTLGEAATLLAANRPERGGRRSLLELLARLHVLGFTLRAPELPRAPAAAVSPTATAPAGEPPATLDPIARRLTLLEPIAVVGIGGVLPDAAGAGEYWQNLLAGHSAIREVPQDAPYRWPIEAYYDPDPYAPDKTYSKIGAFAPEVEFRPIQFRIPPAAAARMDRGQKLALLATREALADSGDAQQPSDRTRVRVVIGTSVPDVQDQFRSRVMFDELAAAFRASPALQALPPAVQQEVVDQARRVVLDSRPPATEDTLSGGLPNLVAGRVALCFDVQGGNVTLDAACASSLAALDHAIAGLRLGEVDLVIAGGVDTAMSAATYVGFAKASAISATGSFPFDSRADGFVMGEGAGVLILQRLSDAERQGRRVYAVIRAVGTASDGKSRGVTAPSAEGQARAIRRAYDAAGVDPATVGMIEAHGTSTVLGDATEFASLRRVFDAGGGERRIYLGSVKSTIGHLKAAAGIAGVIKAVLSVYHGRIPPTPTFRAPAAGVALDGTDGSPFTVNTTAVPWPHQGPTPRRAGVNSFGFGGTNYHAIVEAYDPAFYNSQTYREELLRSRVYREHYLDVSRPAPATSPPGTNGVAPPGTNGIVSPGTNGVALPHPGGPARPAEIEDLAVALRDVEQPLAVVEREDGRRAVVAATSLAEAAGMPGQLRGWAPALGPHDLGSAGFRRAHGVCYAYVVGDMAGGISSVDLVEATARAGMLGFFGTGGLSPDRIEAAIGELRRRLGDLPGAPVGMTLLHNPAEPGLEDRTVDLLLEHDVRAVCASAFLRLTPSVVRYRATGMRRLPDGRVEAPHRVFAKVSALEVAEQLMAPPPEALLRGLVAGGALTAEEAALASELPVAEDVTAEADSGGHTDRRPLTVLLPQLLRLRDDLTARLGYRERGVDIRVGAAGGIGDPTSVRAAFAMGADYVLTGSINQTTVQAGTAPLVKQILAEATMADVAMAPAADMFEMGVQVQVLKRGTLYAQRARKLYELYRAHERLEDIPAEERVKLERDVFRASLEDTWAATERYWQRHDPRQLERAARDPRHRMALAFRSYLGQSWRWAQQGQPDRKSDFQVWCGPAIGLFNRWVAGSWLEPLERRDVVDVGLALLRGACVLARAEHLATSGIDLPARSILAAPGDLVGGVPQSMSELCALPRRTRVPTAGPTR
jgi:PfaD family protein